MFSRFTMPFTMTMKTLLRTLIFLGALLILTNIQAQDFPSVIKLDKVFKSQAKDKSAIRVSTAFNAALPGNSYQLSPDTAEQSISIWDKRDRKSWTKAKYLAMEVLNPNDYMVNVYVHFYLKQDRRTIIRRCAISVGLLPDLPTKMVIPLNYLDAQQIYLPRFARQLKGRFSGGSIRQDEIEDVRITLDPVDKKGFKTKLILRKAELQTTLDNRMPALSAPYIDEMGQPLAKAWPDKMQGTFEHGYYLRQTDTIAKASGTYPLGWSKEGSLLNLKSDATGWFRVGKVRDRWWLIDPNGYAFLSVGVTGVRPQAEAVINGFEELYQKLPEGPDTIRFKRDRNGNKVLSFTEENWHRAYGRNWRPKWDTLTRNLMKQWRFNTIANWSDPAFIKMAEMPYVLPLKAFPRTKRQVYRDFPDVYDPSWKDSCAKFAQQLRPYVNDRNLIGYFLSNEPEWAFSDNNFNLALEMMRVPFRSSYTRKELRNWLINRYRGDAEALSKAWGIKLKQITDLDTTVFSNTIQLSDSGKAELQTFSRLMVDQYLKPVCDAVKEVDPHHLNLGMRYAWISSDLCYHAGQYFDVFTINGYNSPAPPATAEITKRTGRPVIIGEFHFGALDQGLPSTGICGVETTKDRGIAYQHYVENGFARPEVVGIHYFQWNDQPLGGRFDGENYNIGVINVGNLPYHEFTNYVRDANARIYDVARRFYPPANRKARYVPAIY